MVRALSSLDTQEGVRGLWSGPSVSRGDTCRRRLGTQGHHKGGLNLSTGGRQPGLLRHQVLTSDLPSEQKGSPCFSEKTHRPASSSSIHAQLCALRYQGRCVQEGIGQSPVAAPGTTWGGICQVLSSERHTVTEARCSLFASGRSTMDPGSATSQVVAPPWASVSLICKMRFAYQMLRGINGIPHYPCGT